MIQELIYHANDYYPFSNNPSDVGFQKYKSGTKKGKSGFDKAYDLFNTDSAHKQHRQQDEHQGNPWKYYEQLMDQIIKRYPEYKIDFENGMNNNHENVYNGE